jgi:sulfite reductase (NADPH) flavoprotein alpha-component
MNAPLLLLPLAQDKAQLLSQLVQGLSPAELQWLSGYAAGLAARPEALPLVPAAPEVSSRLLTVVYGTASGNSKKLAERLKQQAESAGHRVRVLRASDYPLKELATERLLTLVISTQGDGDPPDDSRALYAFITGKRAPRLNGLSYSVLALGDSSYPRFCHVGRVLDERLTELGATALVPRADCDLDFEPRAKLWLDETVQRLAVDGPALAPVTTLRSPAAPQLHTAHRPFVARVLANQRITAFQADKDVRHLELSLEGSGLTYQPGDALGVRPRNPSWLVDDVLAATRLDGDVVVARDGLRWPLSQWLVEGVELTKADRPFLLAHAERNGEGTLKPLLLPENQAVLRDVMASHQVVDVLRRYPASWNAQDLVATLRRLKPRLYSIASSQLRTPQEVHLTVALVEYQAFGRRHVGSASHHLGAQKEDAPVEVFVEANDRFRLPRDGTRNIIMVGPGTGVAPFRAFVQERAESGARGHNWLFFGEQHFRTTFLYQLEWQEALKRGTLHRLDLAFSRDQASKVYVQHRLREQGAQVFAWLQDGGHLYVCGDAKRMAPDVERALLDVAAKHGGLDEDGARAWLMQLSQEQRYLRDVY